MKQRLRDKKDYTIYIYSETIRMRQRVRDKKDKTEVRDKKDYTYIQRQ